EDYRHSNTPVAFYQPPSLDGSRPGLYYVNPTRLNDLPRYRLAALAFHEALPGHHLQISLAQENQQLPAFRRILHSPAFTEGWALYAEKLAGEMGVYEGPQEEYGRLVQELWRAVRLVLDTGLHAKGWSREQALQYQLDNTPFSQADTDAMISRYLVLPGQAVAYSMGEQRLWSIRRAMQNRLGSRFDLAHFHTALLSQGRMALDGLEEQMKLWAGPQREGNLAPGAPPGQPQGFQIQHYRKQIMRLSDGDIEQRLADGSIVIEPAPASDDIAGISVDLRLDHRFRVFNNNSVTHLDLSGDRAQLDRDINRIMSKEIEIAEGDALFIHPGELVLGATLESVTVPDDLVGWLDGR